MGRTGPVIQAILKDAFVVAAAGAAGFLVSQDIGDDFLADGRGFGEIVACPEAFLRIEKTDAR